MKFPWRDIQDIHDKKDFEALLLRSKYVTWIYFVVGGTTVYLTFDWKNGLIYFIILLPLGLWLTKLLQ